MSMLNFLLLLLYFSDTNLPISFLSSHHFLRQTCYIPAKGNIKQELHCLGISIYTDLNIILLNIIYFGYILLHSKFGTDS